MPLVNITIEKNKVQNYSYHFSEEKILLMSKEETIKTSYFCTLINRML